ncbi:substrate-binding domain-containing protein [Halodesulfovibrio sp.]|jgi:simple sugar transport system substrate-binding protein|uniref:sugar ABC transporter substrate-binding protein n=1 Tax=Halodesulfovibrio sp. TaxID=1912772 RepID=UPI0025FFF8E5|nr:substrate-binding domain-containing protein [Halodesulfovibrio sp.]MCT4534447.1 substrate-binding domain-containing protein [Halodesulfovibrio sp.]MCT4626438.1 substrate-binding domain-containing protein [Halodesulfovibrio sp.]
MQRRKNIFTSFICFMLLVAAATISLPNVAFSGSSLEQAGKGMTIYFDTGGPVGGTYNTIVQNGAAQAAADLGCTVEFMYSDWSPQKMIENFKQAMATSPDGIVVMGHPGDDAFAPFVKEAEEAGIIVTASDTELPRLSTQYQSRGFGYAGVDNKARGRILATEAINRFGLKKGEKALVWGLKSQPTRGMSTRGIIETLEAAGLKVDYQEISPEVDKDATLGKPLMTAYLSANPDCRIVIMDHGALTAQLENFFRAAGVGPKDIIGAGFSLSPATASAIKSGYVDLVGDGQPFLQGYLPVLQIVLSKKYGFSGLVVNTGAGFVHKGNIALIEPLAKKGLR